MVKNTKNKIRFWLYLLIIVISITIGFNYYENLSASNDETYKGLKMFSDVLELIENNYVEPVDSKKLMQKAIQGMVHSLDPHSQFLPPEAFTELQSDTKGEFEGIGISITMPKGILTVISPIVGTPAYKAGIKPGDIIAKVDGESTKDMMLWEAVKKMRGPKGTEVKISVIRKGERKLLEFNLTRDVIPIESVKFAELKPGYGYIWITNFRDNTTKDLTNALKKLENSKTPLKGLILDLRDNPGGLLDQSIKVADLFLDKGDIVSIKARNKKHTKSYGAKLNEVNRSYPIVVLINGGSASASEIVAGALQDHKRAIILGTTSFGKGSVQTVAYLNDGYGLKYTIARYYTPSGRSIQLEGIEPDITVKKTKEVEVVEEDYLKEKDLKNHLIAEPKKKAKKKKEVDLSKIKNIHGPLKVKNILSDNQVQRALDLLISYNTFKHFNTQKTKIDFKATSQ